MKKKRSVTNILFCGTGGQGVLSAAEVCGWAALYEGHHTKKSEVHGMAQRGGSVESHVRFGPRVYSPLIPDAQADILVPFHAGEHARMKHFLKAHGVDLLPALEAARASVTDQRSMNSYLLGALSCHLELKEGSWLKAIDTVFAGKRQEENKEAFRKGRGHETSAVRP